MFNVRRFRDEKHLWERNEVVVDFPCFGWLEWVVLHHLGIGGQPQQAEHGHAAEGKLNGAFPLPILAGAEVMLVILAGEGQPDINVGQVNGWHGHRRRR